MIFGFDDEEFKKSTAAIFGVLLVTGFVPILNLVRIVPLFKEIALGAAVVAVFTSIEDTKTAIKFSLATGMIAAVAFNVVYIPGTILLGGLMGAGTSPDAAGGMAMLAGLGAVMNLIGLIFFSPIGYVVGGAIGSVLNE